MLNAICTKMLKYRSDFEFLEDIPYPAFTGMVWGVYWEYLTHCGLVTPYGKRPELALAQVMAPSHYLNQCLIINNHVLWHSPESNRPISQMHYPNMHQFVTEMCTHVHISVMMRCIVGYGTGALWDLCNWFISQEVLMKNRSSSSTGKDFSYLHYLSIKN